MATRIPSPSSSGGSRAARLLIVDDESEITEMLDRHFQYLGYEVECAENGRSALEVLHGENIDVVVSDIRMPVMDGIAMLRAARVEYPSLSIIMMTGYITQSNVLDCMQSGASSVIFKPIQDLELLERAIECEVQGLVHWWKVLADLRGLQMKHSA